MWLHASCLGADLDVANSPKEVIVTGEMKQATPKKTSSMGVLAVCVILLVLGGLDYGMWVGKGKYYELRKKALRYVQLPQRREGERGL